MGQTSMKVERTRYTLDFSDITEDDHARVGGKCASLGIMTRAGVAVPLGFAVTTDAFAAMLDHHGLRDEIERHLVGLDASDLASIDRAAQAIRIRIRSHRIPKDAETAV